MINRITRAMRVFAAPPTVLFSAVMSLLPASLPAQHAPRVLIEGFRTTDTLTRHIAARVRAKLPELVSPASFRVMTSAEIRAYQDQGAPDDFGGAWIWADLREAAKVYRVASIVDLVAERRGRAITVQVIRLQPATARVDTLAPITAPSTARVVSLLVRRLAADSVLRIRR
jgi:hypothetical protein